MDILGTDSSFGVCLPRAIEGVNGRPQAMGRLARALSHRLWPAAMRVCFVILAP